MRQSPVATAHLIALFVPAALLAGAYGFQLIGHLYPCEMCWWQRYPHFAAVALAALAFVVPDGILRRLLIACAGGAIIASGVIGVMQAGAEYHWWRDLTPCTSTMSGGGGSAAEMLARIMKAPIVRCDVPQWTFAGVSLAGFNAIISVVGGLSVFALLLRRRWR